MAQIETVQIPVAHGTLEGLMRLPDAVADASEAPTAHATPPMAAVVCHPHPRGGGTMHNKVVFRVAQALGEVGMPTLRFNFRGVGRSTGSFDEGRGERDDVRAALEYLAAAFPHSALCLAGFSFGAWVGLPVGAADARVGQLIGVGVPVESLEVDPLAGCATPKLIVQGDHDQYGPPDSLRAWYQRLSEPKHLIVVPGADHFFTHHQAELREAIVAYFAPR